MKSPKEILWRVYVMYFVVCAFGLAVVGRAAYIQFVQGDEWRAKAEQSITTYHDIPAVRGNIYSANGSLLATSVPIYEVRMDFGCEGFPREMFVDSLDVLSYKLSEVYPDIEPLDWKRNLTRAFEEGKRYHLIRRGVKYTELKRMREFPIFNRGAYKGGFMYMQENKRVKPFRMLAARTIGYDREGIKPVGLEGRYGSDLAGQDGKRLMTKIANGAHKPVNDGNEIEPIDGADVYTTIDINIQDVAESALLEQLEKQQADHGCVVVMEVQTGHVKAIANLSRGKDGEYYERYNYAVGESTEPGSTFKLMSLMAMLEDGRIQLSDSFDTGNGRWKYYDAVLRDSHRGGFGWINVKDGFAYSSNILVAKAALHSYNTVPQQYIDRISKMSIIQPHGIEIAGEGKPFFKTNVRDWSGITLPWSSIGYEVRMTPLQQLTFYNAVANDGRMMKPMFVKEIRRHGRVVKSFEPTVLNEAIASRKTIEAAQEMCEAVVEYGTGKTSVKNDTYRVAGKTGTARIANDKYGYKYESEYSYQASFVGYFPADNPRYSCIVVVNAPSQGVYYGNAVAGPIFKRVADRIYALSIDLHHELEPAPADAVAAFSRIPYSKNGYTADLGKVFSELGVATQFTGPDYPWSITQTGTDTVQVMPRKVNKALVPNVIGMGASDALFLLENMGIRVQLVGSGTIKEQSVQPGLKIEPGMQIVLNLS